MPPGYACQLQTTQGKDHLVIKKLNKEILVGRIVGPFLEPPLKDFVINPLGLVPKTSDTGQHLPTLYPDDEKSYCLITDLRKSGLNAGIPKERATVQYTQFETVIRAVQAQGHGSYLAKTDLSSAFRHVPIHPQDWHLLGMKVWGTYLFDKCLPFGLSTSCVIFEEISTAIEAISRACLSLGQDLHHYLDDFIRGVLPSWLMMWLM